MSIDLKSNGGLVVDGLKLGDVEIEIGRDGPTTYVKINGERVRGVKFLNVEISAGTGWKPEVTLKFGRRTRFNAACNGIAHLVLDPDHPEKEEQAQAPTDPLA